MGIATGAWVVGTSWMAECTEKGQPTPEQDHEVLRDASGAEEGPILGRVHAYAHNRLLSGHEVSLT